MVIGVGNGHGDTSSNPEIVFEASRTCCETANKSLNIINNRAIQFVKEGARGVMVMVVGNGHGDTSSNPGRDWLHFT